MTAIIRSSPLLFLLLSLSSPSLAGLHTALSVGEIEAGGWRLSQVQLELSSTGQRTSGSVRATALRSAQDVVVLRDFALHCGQLRLFRQGLRCADGRLHLAGKALGRIDHLELLREGVNWSLKGSGRELQLEALSQLLPALAPDSPSLTAAGLARLRFELSGSDGGLSKGQIQLKLHELNLSNAASTLATEGLSAQIDLRFSREHGQLELWMNARLAAGYAYLSPILQDYAAYPAQLRLAARWDGARERVQLRQLRWQQQGVATLRAQGRISPQAEHAVETLRIDIEQASFPGLYSQALEPWLAGTPLDELSSAGQISGQVQIRANRATDLRLNLTDVHLDDRARRFAVYGLDGVVQWRAGEHVESSALAWDGLYLGRMPFGPARWEFRSHGAALTSERPLRVDFFDGVLTLEQLRAKALDTAAPELSFQATLEPVSLPLLSSALGLPSFPGKLAGRLPPVEYRNNQLRLHGAMTAEAFGGSLRVENLVVDQPLGLVPRASADVALRQLELSQLTSVFDFGRIDGRLNADISDLELESWRPVAFSARLYTPDHDPSPQRISQRAVNNLSRVGGGKGVAALSSGFMRYFETFGYEKMGWSCVLYNGVCTMGGLGPAKNKRGYFIVQGRGLPRINVVGHATRVSWDTLLRQLQAVSAGPQSVPP